jgi:hypothetical protein
MNAFLTVQQTMFSTPFFYLHGEDQVLAISPSFWVFVAIAVPLTSLTVLYWRWSLWRKRRERRKLMHGAEDNKV